MQQTPDEPQAGQEPTAAAEPTTPVPTAIWLRLRDEGRWEEAEPVKNAMIAEARQQGMRRDDAQRWAYGQLERLYPPLPPKPAAETTSAAGDKDEGQQQPAKQETQQPAGDGTTEPDAEDASRDEPAEARARASDDHLPGLYDQPAAWGRLPANADLRAELAWVQANRLTVVEQRPSGSPVVHLDRAESPAPSMAALAWLETSIRTYAKYVDVVGKHLATAQDDQATSRRERIRLDDIRALLET